MRTQISIIGGGESIAKGMKEIDLKNIIKNTIIIGCNSAFFEFDCDAIACKDKSFVEKWIPELNKQKLIITTKMSEGKDYLNTTLFECNKITQDTTKEGVYTSSMGLTGIFILSLINDLFDNTDIFLFGYDFNKGNYHDRNKRNTNTYQNYTSDDIRNLFYPINHKEFRQDNRIYNVTDYSKIENFMRIEYSQLEHFIDCIDEKYLLLNKLKDFKYGNVFEKTDFNEPT